MEAEESKLRKPRNQFNQTDRSQPIINHGISNSSVSSVFNKKKGGSSFRGLGCKAVTRQVSVPAVIRSSAEWEGERGKKNKALQPKNKKKPKGVYETNNTNNCINGSCKMVIQDVMCRPGINGLSSLDGCVVGSSMDDVFVAKRNVNVANSSSRGKIDHGDYNHIFSSRERVREQRPSLGRKASNTETACETPRPEPEVFGSRHCRHVRHPSPDGLPEIMFFHNSFIMGERSDRFSDWRLDIDQMSYEQLLELGDRIGHVSTGLKEDELSRCIRKIGISLSRQSPMLFDKQCSICQEEYEAEDELGKLDCGHGFHVSCLKQWLTQKNACPVCKKAPIPRS